MLRVFCQLASQVNIFGNTNLSTTLSTTLSDDDLWRTLRDIMIDYLPIKLTCNGHSMYKQRLVQGRSFYYALTISDRMIIKPNRMKVVSNDIRILIMITSEDIGLAYIYKNTTGVYHILVAPTSMLIVSSEFTWRHHSTKVNIKINCERSLCIPDALRVSARFIDIATVPLELKDSISHTTNMKLKINLLEPVANVSEFDHSIFTCIKERALLPYIFKNKFDFLLFDKMLLDPIDKQDLLVINKFIECYSKVLETRLNNTSI